MIHVKTFCFHIFVTQHQIHSAVYISKLAMTIFRLFIFIVQHQIHSAVNFSKLRLMSIAWLYFCEASDSQCCSHFRTCFLSTFRVNIFVMQHPIHSADYVQHLRNFRVFLLNLLFPVLPFSPLPLAVELEWDSATYIWDREDNVSTPPPFLPTREGLGWGLLLIFTYFLTSLSHVN